MGQHLHAALRELLALMERYAALYTLPQSGQSLGQSHKLEYRHVLLRDKELLQYGLHGHE